jgi:hypothetical protein
VIERRRHEQQTRPLRSEQSGLTLQGPRAYERANEVILSNVDLPFGVGRATRTGAAAPEMSCKPRSIEGCR